MSGASVSLLPAAGLRLFADMLEVLEDTEACSGDGYSHADTCQLDEQYRPSLPFRSIVAEYLSKAQRLGPDVVASFCACLSDFVALAAQVGPPDHGRYLNAARLHGQLSRAMSGEPAPPKVEEVQEA